MKHSYYHGSYEFASVCELELRLWYFEHVDGSMCSHETNAQVGPADVHAPLPVAPGRVDSFVSHLADHRMMFEVVSMLKRLAFRSIFLLGSRLQSSNHHCRTIVSIIRRKPQRRRFLSELSALVKTLIIFRSPFCLCIPFRTGAMRSAST